MYFLISQTILVRTTHKLKWLITNKYQYPHLIHLQQRNLRQSLFTMENTYFVSCKGPSAPKEKWHREEHIVITIIIIIIIMGN